MATSRRQIVGRSGCDKRQDSEKKPEGKKLMEVQYKTRSGRLIVKIEAQLFMNIIRGISEVEEIMRNDQCGCCSSVNVRPNYRKSGTYDFYELLCEDCGAALGLGVRREDQKLFPRRKDDDGKLLPNGGWKKWQGRQEEFDSEFPQAPSAARR